MRWARWIYRLFAVAAGLGAASVYALGHARFGDSLNYAADDPSNAQAAVAGVIAIAVSLVLIALHEIARREPPKRPTRWIGNSLIWTSVAVFVGIGRGLGGVEVISSFDVFMSVAAGVGASGVLAMATADHPASDSPDQHVHVAGRK